MQKLISVFFLFIIISSYSQKSVDNYKYVIVPQQFDFLKENDAYELNSLTKFLFTKYGFITFLEGTPLPDDLESNRCKALMADVNKKSALFVTKLTVSLKDCNAQVIFTSKEGASREKEFKASYYEALRKAFESVKQLNYKYKEVSSDQKDQISDIMEAKEDIRNEAGSSVQDNTNVASAETVAIVKDKVQKPDAPAIHTALSNYNLNDQQFVFKKQDYGFELLKNIEGKQQSLGKIYKSNRENTYIIKAGTYSGNGYFDAYGNFILERINPATDKLIKDIFARQ